MILFIGHQLNLSGAPKSLFIIAKHFKDKGHKVCFIIRKPEGPFEVEYRKLGDIYYWDNSSNKVLNYLICRSNFLKKVRHLFFAYKAKKVSCIFNNTCTNGSIVEFYNKHHPTIPVISRIPELSPSISNYLSKGQVGKIFSISNYIIAVSEAVKNNLVKDFEIPASKVKVLYGGIPISEVKDDVKIETLPKNKFIIGSCGRFDFRKGADLFIRLAYYFHKNDLNSFHFTWLGVDKKSLDFRKYREEIRLLNIPDSFFSFLPKTPQVEKFYTSIDVLFMSSREDPFPLVNIEAGRYSVPIITFSGTGGSEEFVTKESGFIIPFGDIEEVAAKIIYLRDNPLVLADLSRGSFERSLNFNNSETLLEIEKIILPLINKDK